jgi:peptidoglycan hydrolase CwlO-like protein
MDIVAIGALVVAGLTFLYTLFNDSSKDNARLKDKVNSIDTKSQVQEAKIEGLERNQDGLQKRMESIEVKLNDIDRNTFGLQATLESIKSDLEQIKKQ